MAPNGHPGSPGSHWLETPGSLYTFLSRLDGQVGVAVNAEKHVVNPVTLSNEVVGQLARMAQQVYPDAGDGAVEQLDRTAKLEPVKPGFTREAGSLRPRRIDR